MDEVSKSGRTVLFVSHNLGYVANICQKCILLDKGRNIYMDKTDKVIDHYLNADAQFSNLSVDLSNENIEDDFAKLLNVRFIDSDNNALNVLFVDTGFGLEFTYQIKKAGSRATANFLIKTNTDEKVFQSIPNNHSAGFESGIYKAVCWFYGNLLNDTIYKLVSALTTHNPTHIHCQFETTFEVFDNPNAPTRGDYRHKMHGVVRPLLRWQSEKIND